MTRNLFFRSLPHSTDCEHHISLSYTFIATNEGNDRLQINETFNGREKIGNVPVKNIGGRVKSNRFKCKITG